jgi:hypothetical protein
MVMPAAVARKSMSRKALGKPYRKIARRKQKGVEAIGAGLMSGGEARVVLSFPSLCSIIVIFH